MSNSKTSDAAFVADLENISRELTTRKIKLENGVTAVQIDKVAADIKKRIASIGGLESQLRDQVDAKNKAKKTGKSLVVKARQGVAGKFGTDSDEYAALGGTKASERKKPTTKSKA